MTIAHEMVDRAVSVRQVVAQLEVDELTLRYRLGRRVDAPDGRAVRTTALACWDERVDVVTQPNERWAMDFMHDVLATGQQRLRGLQRQPET